MSQEKTTEPTTDHVTTQGIQIKVASKVCGKCKRELPSKDFWGSRSSKDGLQGACKDCQLETPLGTHTTNLAAIGQVCPECKGVEFGAPRDLSAPVKVVDKATPKKRIRLSRAHPIGSGHRKECAKCRYKAETTTKVGGSCINAAAIADEKNPAKVCPYKE